MEKSECEKHITLYLGVITGEQERAEHNEGMIAEKWISLVKSSQMYL